MHSLADRSQFQAWIIKQGTHKLAPVHREVVDWISKQFNVHALDFSCETRKTPKASQQLIHIILDSVDEVKKMQSDRSGAVVIAERFGTYLKTTASSQDTVKSDVFPADISPSPEIIVTYRPLKELSPKIVEEMADDERRALLKTFDCVWTISMAVVFFYTDAQIKENLDNGVSAKINEGLKRINAKYGFTGDSGYRFDSKECFDRDYESNWYYYWK